MRGRANLRIFVFVSLALEPRYGPSGRLPADCGRDRALVTEGLGQIGPLPPDETE